MNKSYIKRKDNVYPYSHLRKVLPNGFFCYYYYIIIYFYFYFFFIIISPGKYIANRGSFYHYKLVLRLLKIEPELSQTGTAIKNWGIFIANWGSYYNSRKFLQTGARRIITHLVGIFRNCYIRYLITLKNLTDFKDEKL